VLSHLFPKVEDTFQKGQEKDEEDLDSKPDTKGEDNAIEMSEDFDGKMHDGELEQGPTLSSHSAF
jgi:midasin